MYVVQSMHKSSSIMLPNMPTLEEVRRHAEECAARGHDALVRAFKLTGGSWPNGEPRYLFETSFSVLGGKVTEHADVSIPLAHWS